MIPSESKVEKLRLTKSGSPYWVGLPVVHRHRCLGFGVAILANQKRRPGRAQPLIAPYGIDWLRAHRMAQRMADITRRGALSGDEHELLFQ
jgi:hypothetical protein